MKNLDRWVPRVILAIFLTGGALGGLTAENTFPMYLGWGLVGVAIGAFIMRVIDEETSP